MKGLQYRETFARAVKFTKPLVFLSIVPAKSREPRQMGVKTAIFILTPK